LATVASRSVSAAWARCSAAFAVLGGGQFLAHLLGGVVGLGAELVRLGGAALGVRRLGLGGRGALLGGGTDRLHLGLGGGRVGQYVDPLPQRRAQSPVFLLSEACAVVLGWLFVRHARRDAAPFVPYRLLRGRGFGVMNLINYLYGAAALGFAALVPLYAADRYGISSLGAGTLLTARAVGMIGVAGAAALALRRTGVRWPMVAGFLVLVGGLVTMAVGAPISPQLWLAIGAALTGLGMGLSVPAANNASLQLAPDQVAAIAGLRGMFRQSGAITAVSVTTALIARSGSPAASALVQSHVLLVFAAILLLLLPLVRLVPEHRGSW
jgi:Major Facilitator Superfamily